MPPKPEPRRPAPEPRGDAGRLGRLALSVALVAALVAGWAVLKSSNNPQNAPAEGDPSDPFHDADRAELRAVTEQVSRVIASRNYQDEVDPNEVARLENIHPRTSSVEDLRDSCVTTYRGMVDSGRLLGQMRDILTLPDGGMRPESEVSPADAHRASDLQHQVSDILEQVAETKDRCHDLYERAVQALGINVPGEGSDSPTGVQSGGGGEAHGDAAAR